MKQPAAVAYSVPSVDAHLQPGEQRVGATGGAVATGGDGPALGVEPERLEEAGPGLGDDEVRAREPVEQALGGAVGRAGRSR